MPRKKPHRNRIYQLIGEPPPGTLGVGYIRYSSDLQSEASFITQKRLIQKYFDLKGWILMEWIEEPERSAYNNIDELIEERPRFARLLQDATLGKFQIVVCAFSNRWTRSIEVGYASLTRLRRAGVWWCTSDGQWDIDKVQQDGFNVAFAIDMSMNEAYSRQLSKRTIAGKEDRALAGYHNGSVPFGYLPPLYPKAPDDAPSTWTPPRMPVRIHPENFSALIMIGELIAQGWTDRAIANELEKQGYISKTARFGERHFTKDTIATIRQSLFPREFAPNCGYGTIKTPSGKLVQGKHQAAWSYDLCQKIEEAQASKNHRTTQTTQRYIHAFSQIIVCAQCHRPLRVTMGNSKYQKLPYYRDTSIERKLPCSSASHGFLSVRSVLVNLQFSELFTNIKLPNNWRQIIIDYYADTNAIIINEAKRIKKRHKEIEEERQQLILLFQKQHILENELDLKMKNLHVERSKLTLPDTSTIEQNRQKTLDAGETLLKLSHHWHEATAEEHRNIVCSILQTEGLIYDLERHLIVGLKPLSSFLPILTLGLENTSMWEEHDKVLWLRKEYLPSSRIPSRLTSMQQESIIPLIKQGMSLRHMSNLLGISHETIRRSLQNQHIPLPFNGRKLSPDQLTCAYDLLRNDIPFREVAKQFGISPGSLHRLAKHDSLILKPKGEKLTPTQRKLTADQQQEIQNLAKSGISKRRIAKQFGMSRETVTRLLKNA